MYVRTYIKKTDIRKIKQVDILPSKKQALCKLNDCQSTAIQCIVMMYITCNSCERLITKEHIAMHTNIILLQYFSDKNFKSVLSRNSYNTIGQSCLISFTILIFIIILAKASYLILLSCME